ncbi:MAG: ABC transporter permease [Actinobacteria bacterium]|nr:MAG: ABC transporter permease [Actinomycetota bacterium]
MSTLDTASPTSPGIGRPPTMRRPWYGWALHDGAVVAKRNLLQIPRVPELLFFSLVQPVIFVLLFAYVFGGAIPVPGGGSYREYLIPGVFGQTVAFAAAGVTVGLSEDMHKGIIDRFRSLPMASSGVLIGRSLADLLRTVLVLVVLSISGLLVGWSIDSSVPEALAGYGIMLLFGYAMIWVAAWVGLHMPSPEVANTAGLAWLFPLTFLSNAFVPLAGMPTWLQTIAEWNPISAVVLSARELFGNPTGLPGTSFPMTHPELYAVGSTLLLLLIFVPLSVRKYRHTTSK